MSPDLLAGRYELTERLAGGGMGQVWRGRDRVLERIVAIKTVDLSAQDSTARERFRREAVATAGLSAPNVVQVFDAGVDRDTAFLVMELLTGPSLSQLIHDYGPLSIPDGIHVTREVAKGLLAAHHIGVVHRDIKPGNVMYHGDQVKLVDFGIAQLARNMGAQLTAPATALGTAAYMSPEQATGEGATEKSDWYALGCLMMTIFTGKPPFGGEALAVASQQINSKPPYVSERRPEVPLALDQLVARMLDKEPAQRPSGEEVVEQLRLLEVDPNAGTILLPTAAPTPATSVMSTQQQYYASTPQDPPAPVVPAPAPAPAPAPRPAPSRARAKKRSVWPILLVIMLVLGAGLGVAYAMFTNQPDPVPVAPTPTATATATPTATRTATVRRPSPTPTRRTTAPATTAAAPTTPPDSPSMAPTQTETSGNQGNGDTGNQGNGNTGNQGNSNSARQGNSNSNSNSARQSNANSGNQGNGNSSDNSN